MARARQPQNGTGKPGWASSTSARRHNYVTPIDEKVAMEITIPPGMERPRAEDEDSPHRVLGNEVKRRASRDSRSTGALARGAPAQREASVPHGRRVEDDLEGVVVEVEIIQWPSATQNPRGRVVEILGHENDFGVDVEIVIRKHHIRHVFPERVLEQAQEISDVIP